MSANTSISWTHHTFNPWSGCAKVSAGCTHCYAANLPPAMRRHAVWGEGGQRIPASESYWRQPLTWDRAAAKLGERHRVFCASVADVFEARADLDVWRDRLMALIAQTPHLDWQLLTKRPEYAAAYLSKYDLTAYPNLWIGASVEDQRAADERIPHLLRIPARVRFLSMEPLLGPVELGGMNVINHPAAPMLGAHGGYWINALTGANDDMCRPCPDVPRINWVIVGGESGHKARPMHPDWARSIRDQCVSAGVPFHFKQWGEWFCDVPAATSISGKGLRYRCRLSTGEEHDADAVWVDGGSGAELAFRLGKHVSGRILDGRTWDQLPEALS